MHNISYEVKGDKLTITVDVGKATQAAAPPSASGKTALVASTGGFTGLPNGMSLSCIVSAKR
jgi:hypothetical protein